ncbi:MAG TPA: outer membrane protein assembly factor BamA [Patescibacteria group bacterium]|nr:outer membrane protein assembly factor BamA [Patescibacteria group bacterium]
MKRIAALVLVASLCAQNAAAFDAFTVSDIRLEGLTRIPAGTVFSALPIEKGDRIDSSRASAAVRALFKTGFFNDIELSRQGDILVVKVSERPAISKLEITGNKDLKTEDLMKGLRDIGLVEGETFNRLELDRLTQELTRQYNNRGKYNVSIKPEVEDLDRNRVSIKITVSEGKAAKIRHLNVVGNKAFPDEDIIESFESGSSNWLSWYKRDDQYSREKLSGDMEKLASYYQDRGYVDFAVESTQVSISPNRKELFVTANVREGDVYTLTDIKLTGELVVKEDLLRKLITAKPGETYSRGKLERASEAMTRVLSNIGYAFAEVTPVPTVDREKREVGVTFFVNPGKRAYVRRINFIGNQRTQDEVLRREMRQLEGAWFSQAAIDRSKGRLQRLGYFKEVTVETPKVPGSDDQVDINFTVEEQSAGSFQFGVGYSELQGIITSVSLTQRNFLGTGNTVGTTIQNNDYVKRFDFNFFDPYFTDDGLSIGYNFSLRELDQGQANLAAYTADTAAGEVLFGIPLTEVDTLSLSFGLDKNDITTVDGSTPPSLIQYLVDELGDRARNTFPCNGPDTDTDGDGPDTDTDITTGVCNGVFRQWTVNTWAVQAGWQRDSRNKFFAPTRGSYQRIGAEVALPGSDLEWYKIGYEIGRYFPLWGDYSLLAKAELGYGDGYGETGSLPFYQNFYAGGVRSVRGFEDNTLGPTEPAYANSSYLQPLGGAFKAVGGLELIIPTPMTKGDSDTAQLSAFVDVGNVFEDFDAFDAGELRASAGLSLKWQAPVGPIIINLVRPIKKQDGDRTEGIQFSFGQQF